jgi:D-tyrosyl-tRNA(Tyr) deacylase
MPRLIGSSRARLYSGKNPAVRAVVQRVTEASVTVDGAVSAESGAGLLVLLGIAAGDDADIAARLATKVANLRIFENEEGKFDRSLLDVGGEALVVSQFTLLADTGKGNRPSFTEAARPDVAQPLYELFVETLRRLGVSVQTGVFGARMEVKLVNDGPVTLVLDV